MTLRPLPFLAAPLLLACAAATAQTADRPYATVPVIGQALPAALDRVCPDAAAALPDALAAAAWQAAEAGVVQVRFEVHGNRIRELQADGGTPLQARAVRRAVRGLDCRAGAPQPQAVQFSVRFLDPYASGRTRAVSLVTAERVR